MPQRDSYAGPAEAVFLTIDGEEIRIYENYEVQVSILQQPAAFSLRLGWSKTLEELRQKCQPGKRFELRIGPVDPDSLKPRVLVQSGRIDRRSVPSRGATMLEVKGRDYLAQLYDSYVLEERSFAETTYYALTRKALDIVGLTEAKGHFLEENNDNNRKAVTGTKQTPKPATERVRTIETGATSGGGKLVYKTLDAKLGTRWYDFLQNQYKLAGLFLWSTGEGNFCLARPNVDQEPVYKILYKRGATRNYVNVVDASYQDDTTMRHSKCVVYGRSGGTKDGVKKVRGEAIDEEMIAYGFDKPIAIHDDDVENAKQANYVARRTLAQERREGWKLDYVVAGHTVPSQFAKGAVAVWGPDLVCRVDDDDLEIHKEYYIESLRFARNPQTTTTISLMRKSDVDFFAEVATKHKERVAQAQ